MPEPVVVIAEPEPEPEPVVVIAEPEPEPEPVVVIAEPEPVVAAEPVVARQPARARESRWNPASIAPRDAADWQPSTSLWARRVFAAGSKPPQAVSGPRPPEPAVSWPRRPEPAVANEVVRTGTDAEVAEPAPAE